MQRYELDIDQAPAIAFAGVQLAKVASEPANARWTELALYRTASGKYICHSIGRSQHRGEHDRYSGQICETEAEVIKFFGHRWLAKDLYQQAGIKNVTEVE